jgi:heptosyltransferase-2
MMSVTSWTTLRRILVLRPRALGDVLLVTPALRALKAHAPSAELHLAIDEVLVPLVARNPHIDRIWALPRRRERRWRDWARLYRGLATTGFDLVVDFHGSPRTASLAWLTGARLRVGYALRGRGRLYTLRVPRDTDRTGRRRALYAARTNLEILARLGVPDALLDDLRLDLAPQPDAEATIEAWLGAAVPAGPRVGLSPAGTWQSKTYPVENWVRLGDRLAAAGCRVLLLWGPGERDTAEAVRDRMREQAIVPPPTDLAAVAALVARLDLLVCNDSGIKHMAVARGTPTLTLFGPTNPVAWTPPDGPHAGIRVHLPCIGCNRTQCAHHSCMRLLSPDAVAQRALAILRSEPACAS